MYFSLGLCPLPAPLYIGFVAKGLLPTSVLDFSLRFRYISFSDPNARLWIPLSVMEPVVFRHFKLLNYLRKINLSLEETAALIRRLETDSCRPEDYEV